MPTQPHNRALSALVLIGAIVIGFSMPAAALAFGDVDADPMSATGRFRVVLVAGIMLLCVVGLWWGQRRARERGLPLAD